MNTGVDLNQAAMGKRGRQIQQRKRRLRWSAIVLFLAVAAVLASRNYDSRSSVRQIRYAEDQIEEYGRFARHPLKRSTILNPSGTPGRWLRWILTKVAPGYLQREDAWNYIYNIEVTEESSDDAFLNTLKALPYIKTVNINRGRVTDHGLNAIHGRSELKRLKIANVNVTDDGLSVLKSLSSLGSLEISGTHVTSRGLKHLENLQSLRTIELRLQDDIAEELKVLAGLRRLASLTVSGPSFTGSHLHCLAGHPSLARLNLNNTSVDDEAIAGLKELQHLAYIDLGRTHVTGKVIDVLARLPALKHIDLSSTLIGDDDLRRLANHLDHGRLEKLCSLNLERSQVTGAALHFLESTPLLGLNVSECREIAQGVKAIARMKNLRFLSLSGTDVRDNDLEAIQLLPELTQLDISRTDVGDDGLRRLARIKQLRRCFVVNTRVTRAGLEQLAAAFDARFKGANSYITIDSTPLLTESAIANFRKRFPNVRNWVGPR